jgi:hypothetical protein
MIQDLLTSLGSLAVAFGLLFVALPNRQGRETSLSAVSGGANDLSPAVLIFFATGFAELISAQHMLSFTILAHRRVRYEINVIHP